MTETYDLFQLGRSHLRSGMPAQATVPLEKAKRAEPTSRSIREALGIAYFPDRSLGGGRGRVPRARRARPSRRVRALRARARAREPGSPRGSDAARQARTLDATAEVKRRRRARIGVRAVVQRVRGSVGLGCWVRSQRSIGRGVSWCCWVSRPGTADEAAERLAGKVARLRIFENEAGRFDRSLLDSVRRGYSSSASSR